MQRRNLLKALAGLGIKKDAIADKNASADGTNAILLRKDGKEEYYTGFGADPQSEPQPEYENWLKRTFS